MEALFEGKVIFVEGDNHLTLAPTPKDVIEEQKTWFQKVFKLKGRTHCLEEFGVKLSKEYHVPSWDSLRVERIIKTHNIKKRNHVPFTEKVYETELLYEDGEGEMTANHHLLGLYNGIQNEYQEMTFVEKHFKKMTIEAIDKALEWKLLLQIDSDKLMKWNWVDWGKIYFFMHEDDLKGNKFERVQIIGDFY